MFSIIEFISTLRNSCTKQININLDLITSDSLTNHGNSTSLNSRQSLYSASFYIVHVVDKTPRIIRISILNSNVLELEMTKR